MGEFKYEVAFSFLKEDEELATSLNDLIQNRLSTFYIQRGKERLLAPTARRHSITFLALTHV